MVRPILPLFCSVQHKIIIYCVCLGGGGISYNKSSTTNKSVQSAGEPVRVRIRMQSEGFLHYYVLDAVHRTVDGLPTISILIDQTDA